MNHRFKRSIKDELLLIEMEYMVLIRPPGDVTWQSIIVNKATTLLPHSIESFTHVKPGDYKELMVQTVRTGHIIMADRRINKLRGITEHILQIN